LCCLQPPGVLLVHPAPYLVQRSGSKTDEAFLLGVLSSTVFDWYTRRIVELHMTFELLERMPVPRPQQGDPVRQRIVEIAGTLAAKDKRYAKWAKAVGVPVGAVKTEEEREPYIMELDALVAHLYGLTRDQVEHVFKTFHRGLKYETYLSGVLQYFDKLTKGK